MHKLENELKQILTEKERQYNDVIHLYNHIGYCPYNGNQCQHGGYCQDCEIYLEERE